MNLTVNNAAKNILETATRLGKDNGDLTTGGKRTIDGKSQSCRMISVTQFQNAFKDDHGSVLYNKKGEEVIESAQGLNRTITMARKEVGKLMRSHGYPVNVVESKMNSLLAVCVKVEGDINIGDISLTKDKKQFEMFLDKLM